MKPLLIAIAILIPCLASAQPVSWPPLPKSEFVAGRPATKEDAKAGRAVFVPEKDGRSIGKPIEISVPQYAWHKNGAKKTPVIVIQAEEANGLKVLGVRTLSGDYLAGLMQEFELLGQNAPTQ